jgi:hypothetical protein
LRSAATGWSFRQSRRVASCAALGKLAPHEADASGGSPFAVVQSASTSTSYDDSGSANTAYVYRVRAKNSNGASYWSLDPATTFAFTETPTAYNSQRVTTAMTIKLIHLTELRTAVNKFRAAAGLSDYSFTESSPTQVKAIHVNELRSALDEARALFDMAALTYASTNNTAIAAQHFSQLQNALKRKSDAAGLRAGRNVPLTPAPP